MIERDVLANPKVADQALLWRLGSRLAEERGVTERAISNLEKALGLEYQHLPEIIDLKSLRSDYGKLLSHYRSLVVAATDLKAAPPPDLLARTVRAADRWRALDREPVRPHRLQHLSAQGRQPTPAAERKRRAAELVGDQVGEPEEGHPPPVRAEAEDDPRRGATRAHDPGRVPEDRRIRSLGRGRWRRARSGSWAGRGAARRGGQAAATRLHHVRRSVTAAEPTAPAGPVQLHALDRLLPVYAGACVPSGTGTAAARDGGVIGSSSPSAWIMPKKTSVLSSSPPKRAAPGPEAKSGMSSTVCTQLV